jgi:Hexokinase
MCDGCMISSSIVACPRRLSAARQSSSLTQRTTRLQYQRELHVSPETSRLTQDDFAKQLKEGLRQERDQSTLLMLPSWLASLPSGWEAGSALAVDCGGTSFRVMHVVFGKERSVVVRPYFCACACGGAHARCGVYTCRHVAVAARSQRLGGGQRAGGRARRHELPRHARRIRHGAQRRCAAVVLCASAALPCRRRSC